MYHASPTPAAVGSKEGAVGVGSGRFSSGVSDSIVRQDRHGMSESPRGRVSKRLRRMQKRAVEADHGASEPPHVPDDVRSSTSKRSRGKRLSMCSDYKGDSKGCRGSSCGEEKCQFLCGWSKEDCDLVNPKEKMRWGYADGTGGANYYCERAWRTKWAIKYKHDRVEFCALLAKDWM